MHKKGFTLIELIVVVGIIGLLAATISLSLGGQRARARDARRITDLETVSNAIQQYVGLGNEVPTTSGGWGETGGSELAVLVSSGILSKVPTEQNPQGTVTRCRVYHYSAPNNNTKALTGVNGVIGARDYDLSFHSELATSSPSVHPLNSNLMIVGTKDTDCPYYSAFLFAPKTQ